MLWSILNQTGATANDVWLQAGLAGAVMLFISVVTYLFLRYLGARDKDARAERVTRDTEATEERIARDKDWREFLAAERAQRDMVMRMAGDQMVLIVKGLENLMTVYTTHESKAENRYIAIVEKLDSLHQQIEQFQSVDST